jgi:enoyl-CoA hydratase/carnithine racemase
VRIGKRVFYDQVEQPLGCASALTRAVMAENTMIDDMAEGIATFLDKRRPTSSV